MKEDKSHIGSDENILAKSSKKQKTHNKAEQALWDESNPKTQVAKRIKRPWGFTEILISVFLLVAVQALMVLYMAAASIRKMAGDGTDIDTENVDILTDKLLQDVQQGGNLVLIMVSMYVIWVGMMFYATFFRGLKSFAKDFWLRVNWKRDIPLGIGLAVALRGLEIGIFSFLEFLGVDLTGSSNATTIISQTGWWYFISAIVLASFVGPFCEELFFRGFLLQGFLRNFTRGNFDKPSTLLGETMETHVSPVYKAYKALRNWTYKWRYSLAAILSGVIFGLMHWQGTMDLPGMLPLIETGIIGIIFGFIVVKTKRLGLVIFAHIFFNLSGVLLASSSLFNQ